MHQINLVVEFLTQSNDKSRAIDTLKNMRAVLVSEKTVIAEQEPEKTADILLAMTQAIQDIGDSFFVPLRQTQRGLRFQKDVDNEVLKEYRTMLQEVVSLYVKALYLSVPDNSSERNRFIYARKALLDAIASKLERIAPAVVNIYAEERKSINKLESNLRSLQWLTTETSLSPQYKFENIKTFDAIFGEFITQSEASCEKLRILLVMLKTRHFSVSNRDLEQKYMNAFSQLERLGNILNSGNSFKKLLVSKIEKDLESIISLLDQKNLAPAELEQCIEQIAGYMQIFTEQSYLSSTEIGALLRRISEKSADSIDIKDDLLTKEQISSMHEIEKQVNEIKRLITELKNTYDRDGVGVEQNIISLSQVIKRKIIVLSGDVQTLPSRVQMKFVAKVVNLRQELDDILE